MNNLLNHFQLTKNITLSPLDRSRKLLIAGIPGTGLSYYFLSLIKQDINAGNPTVLIDPHGDLTQVLVANNHVKQKLCIVEFGNKDCRFSINIFDAKEENYKQEVVKTVINLMYDLYDPGRTGIIGPRFEQVVSNAVLTVMYDEHATLIDVIRLLTDASYLKQIMPKLKDEILKNYWLKALAQNTDTHKSEILDYVIPKFRPFVLDKTIRTILEQTESSFNLEKLIAEDKTIVFNLGNLREDKEAVKIISALLMTKLMRIFKNRADKEQKIINLYIDELSLLPLNFTLRLCRESRRLGINLALVANNIADLNNQLQKELLKIENLVSFRLTTEDAKILWQEFHCPKITVDNLCMLKKFHVYIKYLKNGDPSVIEEPLNLERKD